MQHMATPGVLVALSAALATSIGCMHSATPNKPPVPVRTTLVQSTALGNPMRYSASIVPYSQVDLAFQSGGYVDRILQVRSPAGGRRNVDQGDYVTKGTVLAVVREQSYRDKLQQATAQLSRAQAEYQKASLSFTRISELYRSQSATKPDFDSAKAQLDSTTAGVSGAKADVSEATTALKDCSLRAPFSGWIIKRSVDVGSFVGIATNGFTLADAQTVKAVFGIPDTVMSRVKLGERLNVFSAALDRPFNGKVTAISAAADPKSRVFSVEVSLPNPRNELKSGMIASLMVPGQVLPETAMAVPLSAVVRDPNMPHGFAVMVAEGDSAAASVRLQPVQLGNIYGNIIAANSGLQSGERVVTTGASLLKNGDSIRVIP